MNIYWLAVLGIMLIFKGYVKRINRYSVSAVEVYELVTRPDTEQIITKAVFEQCKRKTLKVLIRKAYSPFLYAKSKTELNE